MDCFLLWKISESLKVKDRSLAFNTLVTLSKEEDFLDWVPDLVTIVPAFALVMFENGDYLP